MESEKYRDLKDLNCTAAKAKEPHLKSEWSYSNEWCILD
jgi:hypothetical protein